MNAAKQYHETSWPFLVAEQANCGKFRLNTRWSVRWGQEVYSRLRNDSTRRLRRDDFQCYFNVRPLSSLSSTFVFCNHCNPQQPLVSVVFCFLPWSALHFLYFCFFLVTRYYSWGPRNLIKLQNGFPRCATTRHHRQRLPPPPFAAAPHLRLRGEQQHHCGIRRQSCRARLALQCNRHHDCQIGST